MQLRATALHWAACGSQRAGRQLGTAGTRHAGRRAKAADPSKAAALLSWARVRATRRSNATRARRTSAALAKRALGMLGLAPERTSRYGVKQHRSALCAAPQRYDMRSGATVVPASLVARGARGRQWLRMAAEDCRRPSRVSAETHVASQHNASPNYNDIPHPPFPNMEYPSTWLEILLMWEENICEISPPCGGNGLRGVAGGAQVGWKLRLTSAPLIFSLAGRGRPGRSRPRSGPRDSQEARRHSCTHFGVSRDKACDCCCIVLAHWVSKLRISQSPD